MAQDLLPPRLFCSTCCVCCIVFHQYHNIAIDLWIGWPYTQQNYGSYIDDLHAFQMRAT